MHGPVLGVVRHQSAQNDSQFLVEALSQAIGLRVVRAGQAVVYEAPVQQLL